MDINKICNINEFREFLGREYDDNERLHVIETRDEYIEDNMHVMAYEDFKARD